MFGAELKFSGFLTISTRVICLCFVKIFAIIMLLSSCSSNDPYLYDRPGFDADSRPVVLPNARAPQRVAPDYYNRRQPTYYAPSPYYRQPAPTYAPPANQGYGQRQQYYGGGSRSYSNPYALPQRGFDSDQYYVPPTYYNNVDQGNSGTKSSNKEILVY